LLSSIHCIYYAAYEMLDNSCVWWRWNILRHTTTHIIIIIIIMILAPWKCAYILTTTGVASCSLLNIRGGGDDVSRMSFSRAAPAERIGQSARARSVLYGLCRWYIIHYRCSRQANVISCDNRTAYYSTRHPLQTSGGLIIIRFLTFSRIISFFFKLIYVFVIIRFTSRRNFF